MAVSNLHFLSPLLVLIILLHFFSLPPLEASPSSDLEALVAFRAASDPSGSLRDHWNATASPCSWRGVECTAAGRVRRLVLESLGLRGSLEPLAALTQLRVLSLKRNGLSGPIPDLSGLASLRLLFLSHNSLSGSLPGSLASLSRLNRLDLSHNNLSGPVPAELNRLRHLLTLRLESNWLSGPISALNLPNLQDLNVSDNLLSGRIPETLSAFPESAFSNNSNLCGPPIRNCTDGTESDPNKPDASSHAGAIASPIAIPVANSTAVPSSPANSASTGPMKPSSSRGGGGGARMSTLALTAIILGDVLVVVVISLLLYCFYSAKVANGSKASETEKIVYSSSPYPAATAAASAGSERGRMVFFEGVRRFELEDLLRASAEMLGKGGFGTAYKAVLDDGAVVAVKRLKDAVSSGGGGGRREFEQQMEVLGRLRHQNLVSLRAYYFAREEKLLVYDFMPNASLFWLLHGNRGPGRTPLDWTTRLKIAGGSARGLAYIHSSCRSNKLVHGNVKSTNILVDRAGNACVSDFGLSVFASGAPRSNGYRAPEAVSDGRKLTPKSDVYSFGVLLLEILTGKCPSATAEGGGSGGAIDLPRWVQSVVREEWTAEVFDLELMRYKNIEEEMVGLLQIAMVCTAAAPDQRPRMSHVVKMIEDIRGGADASPGHDSVSESPSVSEDTCGTSQ